MNYTREPIIETIITPKDGYKLLLRNTKGTVGEEYSVDAVEVVNFGNAIFYRSLERPKAFLLPVSDFEVIEQRETRISLKNASLEKSVKIPLGTEKTSTQSTDEDSPQEKKKDKKKSRKRKDLQSVKQEVKPPEPPPVPPEVDAKTKNFDQKEKTPLKPPSGAPGKELSSSVLTKLFPPPSSLISESISKLKEAEFIESASKVDEKNSSEDKALVESREELISTIEREQEKLDHIWTIDNDASTGSSETIDEANKVVNSIAQNDAVDIEDKNDQETSEQVPNSRKRLKKDADSIEETMEKVESETKNQILKEEKDEKHVPSSE